MDGWLHMGAEERIEALRAASGTSLQVGGVLVPDFTAPRPCDVDLQYMHIRLGQIVRFSGHPRALSVQEHQALVATLAERCGEPEGVVRWARYHDAHEYALGDTVAPIKRLFADVMHRLERAWDEAIAGALGIPLPTEEERARVKVYDLLSRRIEWQWVMRLDPADLGDWADGLPAMGETEDDAFSILRQALGIWPTAVIFGGPREGGRAAAGVCR